MHFKKAFLLIASISIFTALNGQNGALSIQDQLNELELEMDSLSIFTLIDSILNYQSQVYSELNVRVSYNSNVLSAGRNLGYNQQGISPGIAYYHKKGFYANISGFWNSGFDPKYSLTVGSLGYIKLFGKHWTASTSYERWIYNTNSESSTNTSLTNSLNLVGAFTSKYFYGSLDYNYLFGNDDAHRLIGNLSGNLTFRNKWIFDKIRISPSFSMIYGNRDVTVYFSGNILEEFRSNEYLRENLKSEAFKNFLNTITLTEEEKRRLNNINNNNRLKQREKTDRIITVYLSNDQVQEYIYSSLDQTTNEYGIMNYSFGLPIIFTKDRFNFILNYSYSIPLRLPGEQGNFDPVGYFGASVTYRIPFR